MSNHILVWDLETIPDLRGFAAANGHDGKSDDEIRAEMGDKFPPRPSRTSPPGGPQVGPSLTAAARDGRIIVRAGTEEWLRQGPNKRMAPKRRANAVRPDTLIPSLQPSTKPGQVHRYA
jgi:hypothetical protein